MTHDPVIAVFYVAIALAFTVPWCVVLYLNLRDKKRLNRRVKEIAR